jgi:hypothetical protein
MKRAKGEERGGRTKLGLRFLVFRVIFTDRERSFATFPLCP